MDLTVAVPCYNGARYVGPTIESLLDQSWPADEIIVVDDGATDESVDVIRRYPVTLVQHAQNRGLSSARNTAIDTANGDILVFIDVDALADENLLEVLRSGYDAPRVGGVGGQGIESNIHSLADRWRRTHASQTHGNQPKDVEAFFGLCMSYRLNALRSVGGFNENFRTNGEDLDVGIRLNAAGYRLRYLPEAKVYHQRTDDEASLKRTMVAWHTGAYYAKRVNNYQAWHVLAGALRRLVVDPLSDLFVRRDLSLARLSWQIGWLKLAALVQTVGEFDS